MNQLTYESTAMVRRLRLRSVAAPAAANRLWSRCHAHAINQNVGIRLHEGRGTQFAVRIVPGADRVDRATERERDQADVARLHRSVGNAFRNSLAKAAVDPPLQSSNFAARGGRSEVRRLKRRIDRSLRKRIAEGVADGTMKPCDIRLVAFAFGGAVNSIGAWYDPNGKLSTSAFVKAYTDILIDGVSMAPAPKPVRSSRSGNASKT